MSKGLRNISNGETRREVIKRRLNSNSGGLGYLAAIDADKKEKEKAQKDK